MCFALELGINLKSYLYYFTHRMSYALFITSVEINYRMWYTFSNLLICVLVINFKIKLINN